MKMAKFIVATLLLAAGCMQEIQIERMVIDPSRVYMTTGETCTMSVHFLQGGSDTVEWFTSNEAIASVSQDGLVTAVSRGGATITAHGINNGLIACCEVQVRNPGEYVEGIILSNHEASLYLGESMLIVAMVTPETALNRFFQWVSTDRNVATVSQSGLITSVGVGEAGIVAITNEGNFTDTCKVTVLPAFVHVNSISITPLLHLSVGQSEQLSVEFEPENATNQAVTWLSGNPEFFTVSDDGLVTGVAPGSGHVMAKSEDGGKTAFCLVSVDE